MIRIPTPLFLPRVARDLLVATLLGTATLRAAAADVAVTDPWVRAPAPTRMVTAAYFTVRNAGTSTDTLVGASSPVAGRVEIHRTVVQNGMSKMVPTPTVAVAAGATVKAEPGGLHLMLLDLKQPVAAGQTVPLTLQFQHAGAITVQAPVRALTAMAPPPPNAHRH